MSQEEDDIAAVEAYANARSMPPSEWRSRIARASDGVKKAFISAFSDAEWLTPDEKAAILAFIEELKAALPPDEPDEPDEGDGWLNFAPWK